MICPLFLFVEQQNHFIERTQLLVTYVNWTTVTKCGWEEVVVILHRLLRAKYKITLKWAYENEI
jgi:hypothetical protein